MSMLFQSQNLPLKLIDMVISVWLFEVAKEDQKNPGLSGTFIYILCRKYLY